MIFSFLILFLKDNIMKFNIHKGLDNRRDYQIFGDFCQSLIDYFNIGFSKHNVEVVFYTTLFERRKMYGYCLPVDDRNFEIGIQISNNFNEMLVTLCHEFVHVKQFLFDNFKIDKNADKIRFKNQNYNIDDLKSLEVPWEVEAYNLQEKLYAMIVSQTLEIEDIKYLMGKNNVDKS